MDYYDAIKKEITKSRKMRIASRLFYYQEIWDTNVVACASFETFRGSWAFEQWFRNHKASIEEFVEQQNARFGYMGTWRV